MLGAGAPPVAASLMRQASELGGFEKNHPLPRAGAFRAVLRRRAPARVPVRARLLYNALSSGARRSPHLPDRKRAMATRRGSEHGQAAPARDACAPGAPSQPEAAPASGAHAGPGSGAAPLGPSRTACAVLGLALFWFTPTVFFGAGSSALEGLGEAVSRALFPVSILSLIVVALGAGAASLRGARLSARRGAALALGAGALASAGTLLLVLAPPLGLPGWLCYAAVAGMGAGSAVVMLCWGALMGVLPSRASCMAAAAAFFLSCLLQLALSALPPASVAACNVCAAAASAALWALAARGLAWPAWAFRRAPAPGRGGADVPWKAFALFFFCSLAGSLIERVATLLYPGISEGVGAVAGAVASLVLLLAVVWAVVLKGRDFASVWPAFMIALLASLMLVPAAGLVPEEWALALVVAEKRCLVVLLWVLLASTAFRGELPVVATFGLGYVGLQSLPNLLGQVAGVGVAGAVAALPSGTAALCAAMAFVIVVALVLTLFDRSILTEGFRGAPAGRAAQGRAAEGGVVTAGGSAGLAGAAVSSSSPALPGGAGGAYDLPGAVEALGRRFDLSARERQVVLLLARGHTFPRISDELGVTMNTIRSHARSIYRKLDVHTRQELVDLVESEAGGGSLGPGA